MSEIDDVFKLLIRDSENFIKSTATIFLHKSSQAVTESWANEIIDILISKNIKPDLDKATIERRQRRGKNLLGPDYPLLETGEWITFIEFRIKQFADHDNIEVGVFDSDSKIGHSGTVTPVWIATVSENGYDDLIPARTPFAQSELQIVSKIENIISNTWDTLIVNELTSDTQSENLVGRIISDGSNFTFRWDS